MTEDNLGDGAFVGREFHDEHGRFTSEKGLLENPRHDKGDEGAKEVHAEHGEGGKF
jgi:hypothetical protein